MGNLFPKTFPDLEKTLSLFSKQLRTCVGTPDREAPGFRAPECLFIHQLQTSQHHETSLGLSL